MIAARARRRLEKGNGCQLLRAQNRNIHGRRPARCRAPQAGDKVRAAPLKGLIKIKDASLCASYTQADLLDSHQSRHAQAGRD